MFRRGRDENEDDLASKAERKEKKRLQKEAEQAVKMLGTLLILFSFILYVYALFNKILKGIRMRLIHSETVIYSNLLCGESDPKS